MSTLPITHLHHQHSNPVQYIQVHKGPRSQYNLQKQISSHHQYQQYNNSLYHQHYASTSMPTIHDNSINLKKYENIPSILYFTNQLCQSVVNEIGHQPKYFITNGHLILPGEFSLTTYVTLTNWIDQLNPTIYYTNLNSDYLPLPQTLLPLPPLSSSLSSLLLPQIIYTYCDYSKIGCLNVIESVPDILKDIRPGTFVIRSTVISLSIGHNEKYSKCDEKNLNEKIQRSSSLSVNGGGSVGKGELSIAINPHHWSVILKRTHTHNTSLNKYSKTLLEIERSILIQDNYACTHRDESEILNNHLNNSSNQKTYADVLQDTTKYNCEKMKIIKGHHEINSATETIYGPKIQTTHLLNKYNVISNGIEHRDLTKSTATFIAHAARSSRVSLKDSRVSMGMSSTKSLLSNNIENHRAVDKINETAAETYFNKMAENFCFDSLDENSFLLAFDEYNKHRERLPYTKLLIKHTNNENSNIIVQNNSKIYFMNLLEIANNNNGTNPGYSHHYQYYRHHHNQQYHRHHHHNHHHHHHHRHQYQQLRFDYSIHQLY